VLRDQWGFDGITVSDWIWGVRDAGRSLDAALDLEMPFRQVRARDLEAALADGRTGWPAVERAGVRLLAVQLRSYARRSEGPFARASMADDAARALSRRVATRAMVLLQNDPVDGAPVLPLDARSVRRIALIGRLATAPNVGDHGSSDVPHTPATSTPLDGLRAAFPLAEITLAEADDPAAAGAAAAAADVAIVVAGYTAEEEGEYIPPEPEPELAALYPPLPPGFDAPDFGATGASFGVGGDRVSLRLRPVDEEIIRAVARANPRTVTVIVAAGAVIVQAWRADVPAIMVMWYAGMQGGQALADLLAGAENPSGRMPFAVPSTEGQLPVFDRNATAITYERLHGQRLLDHLGVARVSLRVRALIHDVCHRFRLLRRPGRRNRDGVGHCLEHRRPGRPPRRAGVRPAAQRHGRRRDVAARLSPCRGSGGRDGDHVGAVLAGAARPVVRRRAHARAGRSRHHDLGGRRPRARHLGSDA
jgi:beta-glucosidase